MRLDRLAFWVHHFVVETAAIPSSRDDSCSWGVLFSSFGFFWTNQISTCMSKFRDLVADPQALLLLNRRTVSHRLIDTQHVSGKSTVYLFKLTVWTRQIMSASATISAYLFFTNLLPKFSHRRSWLISGARDMSDVKQMKDKAFYKKWRQFEHADYSKRCLVCFLVTFS